MYLALSFLFYRNDFPCINFEIRIPLCKFCPLLRTYSFNILSWIQIWLLYDDLWSISPGRVSAIPEVERICVITDPDNLLVLLFFLHPCPHKCLSPGKQKNRNFVGRFFVALPNYYFTKVFVFLPSLLLPSFFIFVFIYDLKMN